MAARKIASAGNLHSGSGYRFASRCSTFLLLSLSLLMPPEALADRISGAVSTSSQYRQSGEESLRMGNYKDALAAFLQALKDAKNMSKEEEATLHADLGEAYLWQGDFKSVKSELSRAQSLADKNGNDALSARIVELQSWLAQGQGDQDRAIQLCNEAIAMRRKVVPGSADLADSLEHLGILLSSNGLMDPGQKAFEEALAIREKITGANSMDVANLLEQVGAICLKRGNAAQGEQMLQRALAMKEATGAVIQPFTPHVADDSVVFHFINGVPNCARSFADGSLIQRITGNGVTIQAAITQKPSDFVKSARAEIMVSNNSGRPVNFLSQPPSFIIIRPKVAIAQQLNADQIAATIEKKGRQKAGWVRFWGSGATTPITTTMIGNGFNPYMGCGYMPPTFGYMPPPFYSNSGGMSIMTTNVPDYQARARAYAKADAITQRSQADANQIKENSLGPTTIAPGETIQGALDFEQIPFTESILRMPVGNAIFEFHFVRDKN